MARKRDRSSRRREEDQLEVVCRLTPYDGPDPCLVEDEENVVKVVPAAGKKQRNGQPLSIRQFQFGHVFDDLSTQKEVFDRCGVDMVQQLITGKNGLLYTYGVTGSGKTFTMAGNRKPGNAGILPRTLDVIFNSIQNRVDKCVFQSNNRNGFEVVSEREASATRRHHAMYEMDCSTEVAERQVENKQVDGYCDDYVCAVFISYVEIYNNYVYDLLDETTNMPVSRDTRVDVRNMVYVDGAKEIEVESADEALEVFVRGEERRRTSDTLLNKKSSRSHSVFTVRLVQAPFASNTEFHPTSDPNRIVVSQLSLVDLAGSERAKRTLNTGERLAEASSINNSLLVLRRCFERLRSNQNRSVKEPVPYRESKMTTLFKNYFEGSGKIRMIICANPIPDDYDENLNVLAFAEESQAICVARGEQLIVADQGPRPPVPKKFFTQWNMEVDRLEPSSSLSNHRTPLPTLTDDDENFMTSIRNWSDERSGQWRELKEGLTAKCIAIEPQIRSALCVHDYQLHQIEEFKKQKLEDDRALARLHAELKQSKRQVTSLSDRLRSYEDEDMVAVTKEEELRRKTREDKERLRKQSRTLQQVRDICEGATQSVPLPASGPSVAQLRSRFGGGEEEEGGGMSRGRPGGNATQASSSSTESRRHEKENRGGIVGGGGMGHYNPRFQRRSKSAPRILDHQSQNRVPTGQVLKMKLPSNTKHTSVPEMHHLKKSTDYVLEHQEMDRDGNLATSIVKPTRIRAPSVTSASSAGRASVHVSEMVIFPTVDSTTSSQGEVIPTAGGGSAVQFNDVERLTHKKIRK